MARKNKKVENGEIAVESVPSEGEVTAPLSPSESVIVAEGEAHKAEAGEPKRKPKVAEEPKFPIKGFVNPWGFIHLGRSSISLRGQKR